MTVDAEIDHLGRLWASAISPGFGVEAAEEFLMETFPRHPDRYETFLGAANFAMRRGEGEVAEALLSYCLASSEEADEASFREISS